MNHGLGPKVINKKLLNKKKILIIATICIGMKGRKSPTIEIIARSGARKSEDHYELNGVSAGQD